MQYAISRSHLDGAWRLQLSGYPRRSLYDTSALDLTPTGRLHRTRESESCSAAGGGRGSMGSRRTVDRSLLTPATFSSWSAGREAW